MLTRILFNSKAMKLLGPTKRCMSEHSPSLYRPTLNDVIPTEPFQTGYNRRQVGNNFVFVGGILFFAASAYYIFNSGVIFLNLTPPKKNLGEF